MNNINSMVHPIMWHEGLMKRKIWIQVDKIFAKKVKDKSKYLCKGFSVLLQCRVIIREDDSKNEVKIGDTIDYIVELVDKSNKLAYDLKRVNITVCEELKRDGKFRYFNYCLEIICDEVPFESSGEYIIRLLRLDEKRRIVVDETYFYVECVD